MSKTLPPIPPNFGKKDPYPPKQNSQTKQNPPNQKKKGKDHNKREGFDDEYFNKDVIIHDDKGMQIKAKVYKTSKFWLMLKTEDGKSIFMNKAYIRYIELPNQQQK